MHAKNEQLDSLIKDFREKIIQYHPIKLLNILNFYYHFLHHNIRSECNASTEVNVALKLFQYVLAIYESTKIDNSKLKDPQYSDVTQIIEQFTEMYREFNLSNVHDDVEGSGNSNVRFLRHLHEVTDGYTYSCFAEPMLEMLLQTQGELFDSAYNITMDNFIKGLRELSKVLISSEIDFSFFDDKCFETAFLFAELALPVSRYDVEKVTGWPESLINDLSCEIGEDCEFFNREKYPGYLDVEMPISKHPFIRYNNHSYCFSYNTLFDHLYRNIRKSLVRRDDSYIEVWKKNQEIVSEGLVAEMLKKSFPGAKVYCNNYYKPQTDTGMVENDIIVDFFGYILIVEVKAGAYTPRSVLLDEKSHDDATKNLIDKAFNQANRTEEYILSLETPEFYDSANKKQFELPNVDKEKVIKIAVSIDAIGEISAGVNYCGHNKSINNPVIAISIYDLYVYCNFFDSPIYFLHFLLKRRITSKSNVLLNDELDYLGAYLETPHFNEELDDWGSHSEIIMADMHYDIDEYFSSYMDPKLKPKFSTNPTICKCVYKLPINEIGICIGLQLLESALADQNMLESTFNAILRRQQEIKHFSQAVLQPKSSPIYPTAVFCNRGKNYATEYKALEYATAIRSAYNYDEVYYFIVYFGKGKQIKKVICGKADESSYLKFDPYRLAQIERHILSTGKVMDS